MNAVTVVVQGHKYELGRNMTASGLKPISAHDHYRRFFAFDSSEVWTADGWLITAVENDGVTHHVRKGEKVGRQTIEPDEVLHYRPSAKTEYLLAQLTA